MVQVPLLGAFEGLSTTHAGPPCETPRWAPGQVPAHWPLAGAVRPYMWCAVGLVQDTRARSAQLACSIRAADMAICLFVCLFVYGIPEVCDGHRLTKDGTYATQRQAGLHVPLRAPEIVQSDTAPKVA